MVTNSIGEGFPAGKVYLVGAGPGHPDLLTIKAARLLEAADVVVYDRLIQEEILSLASPSAERIYMGKPVGRHDSRQDEIHELLARKAREGKLVVRLKGGDPFLFGRGGEEAEYLAGHGVRFEVIPGVSSALAAPLSAGIAITHRNAASSVVIATGHEARKEQSGMDWEALARAETLVFLMCVNTVGIVAQRLMEHGKDAATPAAMIQTAFWHSERVVTATLGTIAGEVVSAGITPPATLVVGEVVRLREKLAGAQRDLEQSPDRSSRFQPAPAPDELLRLASAGVGSQALRFALALGLFDQLEEITPASDLARRLDLNAAALVEILDSLTALGVLEFCGAGYRNLELASRYLTTGSPESLKPAVLHLAAQSGRFEDLEKYAREGHAALESEDDGRHRHKVWASLARFAAPVVAEKLDLARRDPVLLIGWGADEYREALSQSRAPVTVIAREPSDVDPIPGGKRYGAILLSGVFGFSPPEDIHRLLGRAVAALRDDGLLAFHDAFLPAGAMSPPEVLLRVLGNHIDGGRPGNWSVESLRQALRDLGLGRVRSETLSASSVLVTAARAAG